MKMSQTSLHLPELSSSNIYSDISEENPPLDTNPEVAATKFALNAETTVPVQFEGPDGIISEVIVEVIDDPNEGVYQDDFPKTTVNEELCPVQKLVRSNIFATKCKLNVSKSIGNAQSDGHAENNVESQMDDPIPLEKSVQVSLQPAGTLPATTYPFGDGYEDNDSQQMSPINSLTSSEIERIFEQCIANPGDRDSQEGKLRNDILCHVPVNVERAMENVTGNDRRFNNIITNLKHTLVMAEVEKGTFTADSNEAQQFEHTLDSINPDILGAVYGAKLWQRSLQRRESEPHDDKITSQAESQTVAVQFTNNQSLSTINTEEMDIDANTGTPVGTFTSPQPTTSSSYNLDSRPQLNIKNEGTWGLAHDAIFSHHGPVDKALSVCRVLFDDVMTTDDILNRSRRAQFIGKGNKRRKTKPFQPEKLDFIRNACAFILRTEERKDVGTAQFEIAQREKNFKSLDKDTWEKLAQPLLSEYACQRRKCLEES